MKQTPQSKALHAKMGKKDVSQHELTKKNNSLMIRMDRKRESNRLKSLESRSKKAGFYVHGHKNLGDVYEA